MPLPKTMPALADLTQDIAGPVPLDLLTAWAEGRQDATRALELLSAFEIRGTVVASDTSGLSRLCAVERDLLDVLELISFPKEIVHAVGVEIGGRPIGTWVADNTEMFYPDTVAPETLLAGVAETQFRIASEGGLALGICVHKGQFYEIGGGLYGRDAETVENLAEHNACAGETLVTEPVAAPLLTRTDDDFAFTRREDLEPKAGCRVFSLVARRRMSELNATNTGYPHPYPGDFFASLSAMHAAPDAGRIKQEIYARYLQQRAVVFLSVVHDHVESRLDEMLDALVTNALVDAIVSQAVGAANHIAGLGGGIGILTFDTAGEALEFCLELRARFVQNALPVKMGIDIGPVLQFSNGRGRSGITGDPVNVASKISEDAGAPGRINLTTRAAAGLPYVAVSNAYEVTVSGMTLTGIFV